MTERFDAWLETGLRDLENAVPLSQSVAVRPGPAVLARVSPRGPRSRRSVGSLALLVGVILVAAALASRLDVAGPGTSQLPVPSPTATTSSPVPSSSPSSVTETTHQLGSFSIVTPSNWQLLAPNAWTRPIGPFLFISNVAMADPCATSYLGPEKCLTPIAELPPDGIVVTFAGSATPSPPNPTPVPTSEPLSVACMTMGGDRQLGVGLPGFGVSACLRGPNFAENEAAIERLVASIPGPPAPQGTRITAALKNSRLGHYSLATRRRGPQDDE